jgi:hypothetical protein
MNYFEFNERCSGRSRPVCDVIELDDTLVLEGEAAGDTIRRFMAAQERAAPVLLPVEAL